MMESILDWLWSSMPHLLLAPIALPMCTAAIMLLLGEERQRTKLGLNLFSLLLGLLINIALLAWTQHSASSASLGVYLPSNWPATFGIVLALDHLSALMLVLTSLLGLCSALFAGARWHRAGVHFHVLFQFQLMGLSGAFLTADLFNLFVFFEIMLAASYGLLLHGSGRTRVQTGLHYIAINLAASSLFLVGVSMLYGITGTLNMADLAQSIAQVSAADRGLLHSASAILATAFLIKAAAWPLNFWLLPVYSAASAPVGALFAIMTKVGVYTLLRLWTLLFGSEAGASAHFGSHWLIGSGMLTMVFGALGMLGSQRLTHLAAHAAILSAGSLLAAAGVGHSAMTAGLLYYLPSSTLAVGCLFLLADLIERWRNDGTSAEEDAPFLTAELLPGAGWNLDEDEEVLVGRAIPAAAAFLGLAYLLSTLIITGMPPLSGFLGKFAMLSALLNPHGLSAAHAAAPTPIHWMELCLLTLLIATGLMALLALTRTGIRHFWANTQTTAPPLRVMEVLPIAILLGACIWMTINAGAVMRYTEAAAQSLHNPGHYIDTLLQASPLPSPSDP